MPPLILTEDEVQQLQALANSRSLPHSIVQRAQIVLACGAGETNTAIAKRMGLTGTTVGKWRKRYRELGLEGLHDELRPGRPRTYEDETVAGGSTGPCRPGHPTAAPTGVRGLWLQ
jgi:putative transposase